MSPISRRRLLHTLAMAPSLLPGRASRVRGQTRLRVLLNSGYSSVNTWFTLADDRGLFQEAGLVLDYTTGRGAYTAAGRMADEGFDVGYGDVNALVERVAAGDIRSPVAVYMVFNRSPSVVAVPAAAALRTPADLAGTHLRGHATDVALQTFPVLAAAHGLDTDRVRISTSEAGMGTLVDGMIAGEYDGMFGYDSTITAALVAAGVPTTRVRFLRYASLTPDLYGSALMVSRRLVRDAPDVVQALVRAVNRGIAAAVANEAAALAATAKRVPAMHEAAERARLERTFGSDMAHREGARLGIGAIDPERFTRAVAALCAAKHLARVPRTDEIFDASFAVPRRERITRLATARL
ncbi:MAG: ABC transporter substrate-binding protein [Vicinamibacterales bacterium]